jgi:hypothetical protein
VRIHLAAKHALELKGTHARFQPGQLPLHLGNRRRIGFGLGQLQQFQRVGNAGLGPVQLRQLGFQARALATEFLRAIRFSPDLGLLKVEAYLFKAFFFPGVVKGTP